MWLRSFVVFLVAVMFDYCFAISCESLILDDFKFRYEEETGNVSVSFLDSNFFKDKKLTVSFSNNKNNSKVLSGSLDIKESGRFCKQILVDIDPILLCRDSSDRIEQWRFVTYGSTEVLSVVSLDAEVNDPVLLFNSRICRNTSLSGRVFVQDSHLNGGTIFGLANYETNPGNPEYPPRPEVPEIPVPEDEEDKFEKEVNFDFYTVKLVNTHVISGNPLINGEKLGVTIQDTIINGSPKIRKEISIKNSMIVGNGHYEGKAELWVSTNPSDGYFIPLIRNNLVNSNNVSGTFFLQREIENSTIVGSVSRNSENEIDIVAHVADHSTTFDASEFYGFGSISAEITENTYINGYTVLPVIHGVLFESGTAINGASIEGAIYAEDLILDDAEIIANKAGTTEFDSFQVYDTTIVHSSLRGLGFIAGSYIYWSDIYSTNNGYPYIYRSDIYYSLVKCSAIVVNDYLYSDTADCNYDSSVMKKNKNKVRKGPKDLISIVKAQLKNESKILNDSIINIERNAKKIIEIKAKFKGRK